MNKTCEEIEVLQRINDYFDVHKKIKKVVKRSRKCSTDALLGDNTKAVVLQILHEQLLKNVKPLYDLTRDLDNLFILNQKVIKTKNTII